MRSLVLERRVELTLVLLGATRGVLVGGLKPESPGVGGGHSVPVSSRPEPLGRKVGRGYRGRRGHIGTHSEKRVLAGTKDRCAWVAVSAACSL